MADKYLNNTGLQYYHNRIKTIFADKSEIPTDLSDLTNTGQDPYATESYVDQNGGKIDSISVNGVAQTIDANKNVDLSVASMSKTSSSGTDTYTIAEGQNSLAIAVNTTQGSEAVSVGGQSVALAGDIPTALSELTNDEGFIDNTVNNLVNYYTKSETYTQAEVDNLISQLAGLDIQVVQTLPTEDISTHTIYLVPSSSAGSQNVYDEYIYVNNAWEKIGTTAVDLSAYWTSTSGQNNSLIAITTAEIDTIIAGA